MERMVKQVMLYLALPVQATGGAWEDALIVQLPVCLRKSVRPCLDAAPRLSQQQALSLISST
jgi:hypothetical protein